MIVVEVKLDSGDEKLEREIEEAIVESFGLGWDGEWYCNAVSAKEVKDGRD